MKHSFSTKTNANALNFWLLISRIAVGALMLTHGVPKLEMLMKGHVQFPDPLHVGTTVSLALTVFAEFVCSILLILGLATRFAAIPLMVVMLMASFSIMAAEPLGKKELPIIYLSLFVGYLILGAGKYSVDHLIGKK